MKEKKVKKGNFNKYNYKKYEKPKILNSIFIEESVAFQTLCIQSAFPCDPISP